MNIPPLSADLVAELDRAFPERCPDPKDTEREVWMRAGERRLVRLLLNSLSKQKELDLNVPHA